jgi:hypothetical protein
MDGVAVDLCIIRKDPSMIDLPRTTWAISQHICLSCKFYGQTYPSPPILPLLILAEGYLKGPQR